jgi:molecular chaperone GrpE
MHLESAGSLPTESPTGPYDDGSQPAGGPAHEVQREPVTAAPADPPACQEPGDPQLLRIEAALTAIARQMELDTERAAFRERVIDRLHADVERLRAAERSGVLRPVVTDLCRLRNDLMRQAATLPADMTAADAARLLGSFADVVEDALERCGVGVLPTAVGVQFTPGSQQVVETVAVDEPALDGTVEAVVQDGYIELDGGRVVLPARVALRRAVAATPSTTSTTDETTTTKEQPHG